jgi:hypothetical protein
MGSVEGRVTQADSGAPVQALSIFLVGADQPPGAVTDDKGSFRFPRVAAHSYLVNAFSAQYFTAALTVRVEPGEKVTGLNLKAYRFPVIAGRVRDALKRPVPGVKVVALQSGTPGGRYPPQAGMAATTNDLGEFRISGLGLRGGRYTLLAQMKPLGIRGVPAGQADKADDPDPVLANVSTYYPNSPWLDGAAWFTVSPGRVMEAMDLTIAQARTVCVRGKISDPETGNTGEVRTFVDADWYFGGNTLAQGTIRAGQVAEVCGLGSGSYRLVAQPPESDEAIRGVSLPFTVSEKAVRLPASNLQPLAPMPGRLTLSSESGEPAEMAGPVILWLQDIGRPAHSARLGPSTAVRVKQAGSFEIPAVLPDEYWLRVSASAGTYAKSATVGGVDVLHNPLPGAGGELDVVIGTDGPVVSVQVDDDDNRPAAGVTVVVGADGISSNFGPGELASALTDQNGGAEFKGMPPGTYRLLAISGLFGVEDVSPAFFLAHKADGERIELKPKDRRTLQVKARPAGSKD